ncbi:hypothetical protein Tco_0946571 [Tanacetum coccineum]
MDKKPRLSYYRLFQLHSPDQHRRIHGGGVGGGGRREEQGVRPSMFSDIAKVYNILHDVLARKMVGTLEEEFNEINDQKSNTFLVFGSPSLELKGESWVGVLHAFAMEGAHCTKVRDILDSSEVHAAYKDQKHDLFLPSNAQIASAGIAGLIENSSSSRLTYSLTAPRLLHRTPTPQNLLLLSHLM